MDLSTHDALPVKVLSLVGSFNKASAAAARQWLDEATLGAPALVVVDLAGVRFLDSTALSTLVHAMKRARAVGGDVRLAGLQQPVRMIFEMTRLDHIFEMYDQADEAVQALLQAATEVERKGGDEHGG
jgi:anti-sigma B factor antagonist